MGLNRELWNGKRVLVTGHTGFKGSWLTLILKSLGAEVIGFSLPPRVPKSLYSLAGIGKMTSTEYIQDIRNEIEVQRLFLSSDIDYVFHLAAQAYVRESIRNPIESISTNVYGASNVLIRALETSSLLGFTFVTTDKVYKNDHAREPFRESDPLGGRDPYSASKAASELLVSSLLSSNNPHKIPVTVVRAGNVIGGGDWGSERLVPDLIHSLNSDSVLQIRNPNATRPWQHVLDCLNGYLLVAEAHLSNKKDIPHAFNFGPTTSLSVIDLIGQFEAAYNQKIRFNVSKSTIAETDWLELDSGLARRYLGWSTSMPSIEAVTRTAKWYSRFEDGAEALDLMCEDILDFEF